VAEANAPTTEIGLQRSEYGLARSGRSGILGGLDLGWDSFIDTKEYVPSLKWPQSISVYSQMRTDSQLSGLYRAMTYPIRRFKFMIDPNGCRPEIVNALSDDLNMDVQGQDPKPRGRRKGRFSFDDYIFHALMALIYGHMFFEQSGEIVNGMWRLRKLSPRMPETINQINVAPDGGLLSIRQNLTRAALGNMVSTIGGPLIPVDRLVAFPWEKEGPNWTGRSIFRDCYKNWLIKDRLLRVDAVNHERAGGVPIAEAPAGASPAELDRLNSLAQQFKVGEDSGGSVPAGTNFTLHKVGGGTDVVNSIKYHDESMARLFLHMFIQLGQTETGSRALGLSFIEYAFIAQKAVAQWFVDITNEHVIEDWVDWNYADEQQVPLLTYVTESEDEHLAVEELVKLIQAGAITVDPELEDTLRDRYKLPPLSEDFVPNPATLTPAQLEQARQQLVNDPQAVPSQATGLSARLWPWRK
jgi:hypothetical protein